MSTFIESLSTDPELSRRVARSLFEGSDIEVQARWIEALDGGDEGELRRLVEVLLGDPRTAALQPTPTISGNPYHCPAGTGITSGRFTDAGGKSCHPLTEQLSDVGLDQRMTRLQQELNGDISARRRRRLEEEVRRVEQEARLRSGESPLDVQESRTTEGDDRVSPRRREQTKGGKNIFADGVVDSSIETGGTYELSEMTPEELARLEGRVTEYLQQIPGLANLDMEQIIQRFTDNILHEYQRAVEMGDPEGWKMWYQSVNRFAVDQAEAAGISTRAAAGMIAVLSPQSTWHDNIGNLDRGLRALIEDEGRGRQLSDYEADAAKVPRGSRLGELSNEEAGVALQKMFSKNGSLYRVDQAQDMIFLPDGGYELEPRFTTGENPEPNAIRTQSGRNWAKAVSIYRDDSLANISMALGNGAKARTFYNNIVEPFNMSYRGTTMDSHSLGTALGIPMASDSPLEDGMDLYNLALNGSRGKYGLQGSYALFQEGFSRAVEEIERRGGPVLKPSELQSITWMQWREDFSLNSRPHNKGDSMNLAADLWRRFDSGELTEEEIRAELDKIATRNRKDYPSYG